MITKNEVKKVIRYYYQFVNDDITDIDIDIITNNINGNMQEHIKDEIKFYLENK